MPICSKRTVMMSPFLSRTTRSGATSATSSAIRPYCVVPFLSLLYLKVTGLSPYSVSLALSIG